MTKKNSSFPAEKLFQGENSPGNRKSQQNRDDKIIHVENILSKGGFNARNSANRVEKARQAIILHGGKNLRRIRWQFPYLENIANFRDMWARKSTGVVGRTIVHLFWQKSQSYRENFVGIPNSLKISLGSCA